MAQGMSTIPTDLHTGEVLETPNGRVIFQERPVHRH
jgi:hypothetical protein